VVITAMNLFSVNSERGAIWRSSLIIICRANQVMAYVLFPFSVLLQVLGGGP
jgi:hypothetical protein